MICAARRMTYYTSLTVTLILTVIKIARCELDFCEDGYKVSNKFTDCWKNSAYINRQTNLSEPRDVYDKQFLEEYATHMCSVVKPYAMDCLRRDIANCSNIDKIVEMADSSGGTCEHNKLNSFFKLHIIDHLAPVTTDSPCFKIGDESTCYDDAASKIKNTAGVNLSRFHYQADRFFATIWECQVKLFKSKSEICPNWQLPMLISLQQMAMPTLFGMKLTDEHVAMLELENIVPPTKPTPSPEPCDGGKSKFYILLKVLTQKPESVDGGIVLQVGVDSGDKTVVKQINVPDSSKKRKEKVTRPPKSRKEKTTTKDNLDALMIN